MDSFPACDSVTFSFFICTVLAPTEDILSRFYLEMESLIHTENQPLLLINYFFFI